MIDLKKLDIAISELEKSSAEFSNISVMIENTKEIVSKHVESEDELDKIINKVSGITERCDEYEKRIGEEVKDLIRGLDSNNLRRFDEYRKAIDFNYDSLTTEISSVVSKTANIVCESVNNQTEFLMGKTANNIINNVSESAELKLNSLADKVVVHITKTENNICELIKEETTELIDAIDKIIKKSEQDKTFILQEMIEIKNCIQKNERLNRIYFICKMSLSLVVFAVILYLLLH